MLEYEANVKLFTIQGLSFDFTLTFKCYESECPFESLKSAIATVITLEVDYYDYVELNLMCR